MKTETVLLEYETEAQANGRAPKRKVINGESSDVAVIKKAMEWADSEQIAHSTIEVIEVTDRGTSDEIHDSRGNLLDVFELAQLYAYHAK